MVDLAVSWSCGNTLADGVREKLSSLDPSPWRECRGDLLLNLKEDEGQEEVLEDKDEEEEESEDDEKVKEVGENAQLMHATW